MPPAFFPLDTGVYQMIDRCCDPAYEPVHDLDDVDYDDRNHHISDGVDDEE